MGGHPREHQIAGVDALGQGVAALTGRQQHAGHGRPEGRAERGIGRERRLILRIGVAGERPVLLLGARHPQEGFVSILRVSRGSANGSWSSGRMPASIARPRSSSALNSAPSRIMMFEIHSQTRNTIGPARAP